MKDFPNAAHRRLHAARAAAVVIAATALTLGCGERPADEASAGDSADFADVPGSDTADATSPGAATLPPRPDTIASTIRLEGTEEPITLWLYRTPATFSVPFTTYVPADMAAEQAPPAEGEAVRFVAEFGGVRNEQAFLAVALAPAGADEAGARELARAFAERYEIRARPSAAPNRYAWSLDEWHFSRALPDGDTAIGTVALGRHAGRYFFIATHFPEMYADGFGPRAAKVLDEWRWEDTGESLDGTPAGR